MSNSQSTNIGVAPVRLKVNTNIGSRHRHIQHATGMTSSSRKEVGKVKRTAFMKR
jgi:hypothetical protein